VSCWCCCSSWRPREIPHGSPMAHPNYVCFTEFRSLRPLHALRPPANVRNSRDDMAEPPCWGLVWMDSGPFPRIRCAEEFLSIFWTNFSILRVFHRPSSSFTVSLSLNIPLQLYLRKQYEVETRGCLEAAISNSRQTCARVPDLSTMYARLV
jgi:hypothetical protein